MHGYCLSMSAEGGTFGVCYHCYYKMHGKNVTKKGEVLTNTTIANESRVLNVKKPLNNTLSQLVTKLTSKKTSIEEISAPEKVTTKKKKTDASMDLNDDISEEDHDNDSSALMNSDAAFNMPPPRSMVTNGDDMFKAVVKDGYLLPPKPKVCTFDLLKK